MQGFLENGQTNGRVSIGPEDSRILETKNKNNKRTDGPPHHRASQKYLYQHEDTILCQPSYFEKTKSKQKLYFNHNQIDIQKSKSDCI